MRREDTCQVTTGLVVCAARRHVPSYNRTGGLHGKKARAKLQQDWWSARQEDSCQVTTGLVVCTARRHVPSYNRTGGLRLLRHIASGSPFVVIAIRIGGNEFNRAKTTDNSRQV